MDADGLAPTAPPAPCARSEDAARKRGLERIRHSLDFQTIFEQGRSWPGGFLVLYFRPVPGSGLLRLGVIASRRTFRHAVWRNRAKRLLRETVRLNRSRFDGLEGDMLLIARPRILEQKRQTVDSDLLRTAKRAKLIPP